MASWAVNQAIDDLLEDLAAAEPVSYDVTLAVRRFTRKIIEEAARRCGELDVAEADSLYTRRACAAAIRAMLDDEGEAGR